MELKEFSGCEIDAAEIAGRAAHLTQGTPRKLYRLSKMVPRGSDHFRSRRRLRPAFVASSFASRVPSLSGFAALKRCSTTDRYSSFVSVPSWSRLAPAN